MNQMEFIISNWKPIENIKGKFDFATNEQIPENHSSSAAFQKTQP